MIRSGVALLLALSGTVIAATSTAVLNWVPSPSPTTGYRVYQSINSNAFVPVLDVASTNAVISGLPASTNFRWYTTATNSVGESPPSPTNGLVTGGLTAPLPPGALNVYIQTNPVTPAGYYISSSATSLGDGSFANPWPIQVGFSNSIVHPGDTVWLRGGTYRGDGPVGRLDITAPTATNVTFRAYPGERVTIDGQIYLWQVAGTKIWGLEITRLSGSRVSTQIGSAPTDIPWADAITLSATNSAVINCFLHDNISSGALINAYGWDCEVSGNLVYYNGWQAPDRGHGHGFYKQGSGDFDDNVVFCNAAYGIQVYGSSEASLTNVVIRRNVFFDNATISSPSAGGQILIGGGSPAGRMIVASNSIFASLWVRGGENLAVGFAANVTNLDAHVLGNYTVGCAVLRNFTTGEFIGNTVHATREPLFSIAQNWPYLALNYQVDRNIYYEDSPFVPFTLLGTNLNFAAWKANSGQDANSTFISTAPVTNVVQVVPNRHEPGRGTVAVYNWEGKNTVSVDLSRILTNNEPYEIRYVMNVWTNPVVTGTWSGGPVTVPMAGLPMAPVRNWSLQPTNPAPNFAAFLVVSKGVLP